MMSHFKNVRHNSGDKAKSSHSRPRTRHQSHQDCADQAKELVRLITEERTSIELVLDSTLKARKHVGPYNHCGNNITVWTPKCSLVWPPGCQEISWRHVIQQLWEISRFSWLLDPWLWWRSERPLWTCPREGYPQVENDPEWTHKHHRSIILKKIVDGIKLAGGWFSISADEVRDTEEEEYPSLTAHQHQKGHTVPKQV